MNYDYVRCDSGGGGINPLACYAIKALKAKRWFLRKNCLWKIKLTSKCPLKREVSPSKKLYRPNVKKYLPCPDKKYCKNLHFWVDCWYFFQISIFEKKLSKNDINYLMAVFPSDHAYGWCLCWSWAVNKSSFNQFMQIFCRRDVCFPFSW